MNQESLFHFFPRKDESRSGTLSILHSILSEGIHLTKETIPVKWQDYYGKNRNRKLKIEQFRFCLSAITNKNELRDHSDKFGCIGIEFDTDFVMRLGGFPVFYVPTPKTKSTLKEEHIGISLLYRIAEIQEVIEHINEHNVLKSPDIDLNNVIGAIKFLANICYPTERTVNEGSKPISYYNQREWRIIYGLESDKTTIRDIGDRFLLVSYENIPLGNFIRRIILNNESSNNQLSVRDIEEVLKSNNLKIKVEIL